MTRRNETGFTLFEVIVAVLIVGLAFSGIYAIYSSMIGITAQAEHESIIEESARLVLDQISMDLKSLYLPSTLTTADKDKFEVKVDADDSEKLIIFTTMSSLNFEPFTPGMRLNRVTYALDEISSDPPRYRLIRKEQANAALTGKWKTTELILCDTVKAFTISMEEPKSEETYAGLGKAKYLFLVNFTLAQGGDERDYALAVTSDVGGKLQ